MPMKSRKMLSTVAFGMLTGAALAVTASGLSNRRMRKNITRAANKTIDAFGDMVDNVNGRLKR